MASQPDSAARKRVRTSQATLTSRKDHSHAQGCTTPYHTPDDAACGVRHSASSRRSIFAGAASLVAASAVLTAAARAVPTQNTDAELIRICHQFATADLTHWYQYLLVAGFRRCRAR